jgi:putative PIN family toxin of toxin-antitoxin system
MIDANIIISAGLFPESSVGKVLSHIAKNHKIVLCRYTLDELEIVFKRKFFERIEYFNDFIRKLKYELVDINIDNFSKYPQLRDFKDIPLLAYSIESKVDLLLTGDKDFDEVIIKTPQIVKPSKYIELYMNR